jgi:hypothetical protein
MTLLTLMVFQCAPSRSPSDTELSKLDNILRHLLINDEVDDKNIKISLRANGEKEYAVIIRSDNIEELKKTGIQLSSALGDVIVTRVTKEELKKIISLRSIKSVEVGSRNFIQEHSN